MGLLRQSPTSDASSQPLLELMSMLRYMQLDTGRNPAPCFLSINESLQVLSAVELQLGWAG